MQKLFQEDPLLFTYVLQYRVTKETRTMDNYFKLRSLAFSNIDDLLAKFSF